MPALTRSRVIAGASGLAGEPADEPLPGGVPMWLRYEIVADIETELLRDLNQSIQNRTMAKTPIRLRPNQREFTLPQSGLENATYISLSIDGNPNVIPESIDITNVSTIDMDAREGRRTIAFFDDKPQRGFTSWLPTGREVLTVWFDRSPDTNPSAEQSTFRITDSYVPLLKARLAAHMLELLKQPIGPMLTSMIARGMSQWQQFVERGQQQGVVEKPTWRGSMRQEPTGWWDTEFKINFE